MDIDYPRTRTYRLGEARDSVSTRRSELEAEQTELERARDAGGDGEVDTDRLQTVRSELADVRGHEEALDWAVAEFGADAEITLSATTTGDRSRVLDTLRNSTVGSFGSEKVTDWLLAASIEAAPWQDPDDSLVRRGRLVESLPPALTEWLRAEQESLNGLTEGN
jgi:hypothetical protein